MPELNAADYPAEAMDAEGARISVGVLARYRESAAADWQFYSVSYYDNVSFAPTLTAATVRVWGIYADENGYCPDVGVYDADGFPLENPEGDLQYLWTYTDDGLSYFYDGNLLPVGANRQELQDLICPEGGVPDGYSSWEQYWDDFWWGTKGVHTEFFNAHEEEFASYWRDSRYLPRFSLSEFDPNGLDETGERAYFGVVVRYRPSSDAPWSIYAINYDSLKRAWITDHTPEATEAEVSIMRGGSGGLDDIGGELYPDSGASSATALASVTLLDRGDALPYDPAHEIQYLWFCGNEGWNDAVPIGMDGESWSALSGGDNLFYPGDMDEWSFARNSTERHKSFFERGDVAAVLEDYWTDSPWITYTTDDIDPDYMFIDYDGRASVNTGVLIRWRESAEDDWSFYAFSSYQTECHPAFGENFLPELTVRSQYASDLVKTPYSSSDSAYMSVDVMYLGGELRYQWYRSARRDYNGTPVEGETGDCLSADCPADYGVSDFYYLEVAYPDFKTGEEHYWYSDIWEVYRTRAQGFELRVNTMELYMDDLSVVYNKENSSKFKVYNVTGNYQHIALGEEGWVNATLQPIGTRFYSSDFDYLSYEFYKSDTEDWRDGGVLLGAGEVYGLENATVSGSYSSGYDYNALNQMANMQVRIPTDEAGAYWVTAVVTSHCGDDTFTAEGNTRITVVENPEELYEITADGVLTGYKGIAAEIVIPGEINGIPVKKISGGFSDTGLGTSSKTFLRKVTFPEGLEEIEGGAFWKVATLEEAVFPSTLVRIGQQAFQYTGLRQLEFHPDTFPELASACFNRCGLLETVIFPKNASGSLTSDTFSYDNRLSRVLNWQNVTCDNIDNNFYGAPVREMLSRQAEEDGTLYYSKTSDGTGWVVFGYLGEPTEITIPDTYEGLPVVEIDDYAFYQLEGLERVTIGANVTKIGRAAFYECFDLKHVTFPGTLSYIGQYAFKNTDLLEANFADACLSYIGPYAFAYNFHLASPVTVQPGCVVADHAFLQCYSVPEVNVDGAYLENAAFNWCVSIEAINGDWTRKYEAISEGSYCYYDNFLFAKCLEVTTDSSPYRYKDGKYTLYEDLGYNNRVTYHRIGDIAYCYNTVENHWSSVYYLNVFDTDITVPSHVVISDSEVTVPNVRYSLLDYMVSDRWSLTFEDGIESIDANGRGCIASIRLPDTLKSFTENLFYSNSYPIEDGSPYLEEIHLPASIETLPKRAFGYCANLKTVTFDADWTLPLSEGMFFFCRSLDHVVLPDILTDIPRDAFRGCTGLTDIHLPANLKSIGYRAFANTWALESISFPSGFSEFTTYDYFGDPTSFAFANSGLRELDLTGCPLLTEISGGAFMGTKYLHTVKLGDAVTAIGEDAFQKAALSPEYFNTTQSDLSWSVRSEEIVPLREIRWPQNLREIGAGAFWNAFSTPILYDSPLPEPYILELPDTVRSIGDQAFGCHEEKIIAAEEIGCYRNNLDLSEGRLPASLTRVGKRAFFNSRLSSLVIPESMTVIAEEAFYGDSFDRNYLTGLTLHDGITEIRCDAFQGAHITVPDGRLVLPKALKRLEGWAFVTENVTDFEFPAGIEFIGDRFTNFSAKSYRYEDGRLIAEEAGNYTITILSQDGALPVIELQPELDRGYIVTLRCYENSAAHTWGLGIRDSLAGTEHEDRFRIVLIDDSAMLRLQLQKRDGSFVGESELRSVRWFDETVDENMAVSTGTALEGYDDSHVYRVDVVTSDDLRYEYTVPATLSLYVHPTEDRIVSYTLEPRERVTYTGVLPRSQYNLETYELKITASAGDVVREYYFPKGNPDPDREYVQFDFTTQTFSLEVPRVPAELEVSAYKHQPIHLKYLQMREKTEGVISLGQIILEPNPLALRYPITYVDSLSGRSAYPSFEGDFTLKNLTRGTEVESFYLSGDLVLTDGALSEVSVGDELELSFAPGGSRGYTLTESVRFTAADDAGTPEALVLRTLTPAELDISVLSRLTRGGVIVFNDKNEKVIDHSFYQRSSYSDLVPGAYTVLVHDTFFRDIDSPDFFESAGISEEYYGIETVTLSSNETTEVSFGAMNTLSVADYLQGRYSFNVWADMAHAGLSGVPVYLSFDFNEDVSVSKCFSFQSVLGGGWADAEGYFVGSEGQYAYLIEGEGDISAVYTPGFSTRKPKLEITTTAPSGTILFYVLPRGQTLYLQEIAYSGSSIQSGGVWSAGMPNLEISVDAPPKTASEDSGALALYIAAEQSVTADIYVDDELQSSVPIAPSNVRRTVSLPYSFETHHSAGEHTVYVSVRDGEGNELFCSDRYRILYVLQPVPSPDRLTVNASIDFLASHTRASQVVDFKTGASGKINLYVYRVNPDGMIPADVTFDYSLTMENARYVVGDSVTLYVDCGETGDAPAT